MSDVTIAEQIACVERELRYRCHVYARRVLEGKMSQRQAERERATMEAVLATLQKIGKEQGELAL